VGSYRFDARSGVDSEGDDDEGESPGEPPLPLGRMVRAEDWPTGLRCGECSRELRAGSYYRQRDAGIAPDGLAIKLVVCLDCGARQ
jgi:hypothetical protein